MERAQSAGSAESSVVTPDRFASGRTFDQYVAYVASPENLKREGSGGAPRRDFGAFLRQAYDGLNLTEQQIAAVRWLACQPGAPAKVLVISEEWSSDCRRDVPALAKMADVAGWELRIFNRDGERFSSSPQPSLDEAPDSNADLMAKYLNHKHGQTYQSIPVAVFFTKELEFLYQYTEYPAIYHKDLLLGHIRSARPGETNEQTQERSNREFMALQQSPFFKVWACAAVDEIVSALHERLTVPPTPNPL